MYYIYSTSCFFKKFYRIYKGCTLDVVPYYEWIRIGSFEKLEDAEDALAHYRSTVNRLNISNGYYSVTEYFITSADNETMQEGDLYRILHYSKWNVITVQKIIETIKSEWIAILSILLIVFGMMFYRII